MHMSVFTCVYMFVGLHAYMYVCVCQPQMFFFLELGLFEPGFLTVSGLCKEAGLGGQRTAGITGLCPPAQRL